MKTTKHFLVSGMNLILPAISFITILLFSLHAIAQTGEIKVRVFDKITKESLPGAHAFIEVGNNKIGATSDLDGRITLKPLSSGKYNMQVTFLGYKTFILAEINVHPGKITFLPDIYLEQAVNILGPAEVVAKKFEEQLINPEQPSKMTVSGLDLNRQADNRNISALVGSITTDVKVNEDGSMHFRGSRTGTEALFIDGVKVSELNGNVPSQAISSITVYTGGIPAQFGDVTGGVVVIETKSYTQMYNEHRAKMLYKEFQKQKQQQELNNPDN
jgi:uncharacterized protein YbjQ (UPF0145 family)